MICTETEGTAVILMTTEGTEMLLTKMAGDSDGDGGNGVICTETEGMAVILMMPEGTEVLSTETAGNLDRKRRGRSESDGKRKEIWMAAESFGCKGRGRS